MFSGKLGKYTLFFFPGLETRATLGFMAFGPNLQEQRGEAFNSATFIPDSCLPYPCQFSANSKARRRPMDLLMVSWYSA